jgi:hypothetical protein
MVSAEILLKWVEKNSTTLCLILSKSIFEFSIFTIFDLVVEVKIGITYPA